MAQANIKAVITAEDRASGTLQGFGGSIKGMATSVALGQLAVQGINMALQKFVEVSKFAINSASDFQQSRIAFETMLGSASAAKKMLRDVSDFAQRTPFELPEVVTGAKQLLAYNIEADKIIPTFKALGNIAAGVGKDKLPQLVLAYGQVRAATKLTGAELRQFTEAGVPLLEMLAKQAGKTSAQVKEDMENGMAPSFDDVQKAIFGMSEQGGKFFNLMDKQSKTFGGVMSNVSDNFGRVAREIIGISDQGDIREGSIFAYLQKGAESFLSWLDANKGGIIAGSIAIFAAFKNVVSIVGPPLAELGNVIAIQLVPALQDLWVALQPIMPALGVAAVGSFLLLINVMKAYIGVQTTVVNVLTGFVNFFLVTVPAAFSTSVGFITEKLNYLKNNFWEIIGFIIGFWLTLPLKMLGAIQLAINGIQNYINNINWGGVFSSIFNAWVTGWKMMINPVVATFNYIKNLNWGSLLSNVGKGIGNSVIAMIEGAINGATSGIPGMGKIRLPRFAEGVQNFGGGAAIVGERGPEVVQLPRGSNVIPNHELGGKTEVNITIQAGAFMGSQSDARKLAMMVIEAARDIAGTKNMSVSEMLS